MNNKNLKPFKLFALKNFPFIEADFDAITNYELLCKIVEYLNNVIASQNETMENVQNLSNAFNQLYDYVNDYFDNLDVQEEINNKLDDMVEQGTLQEIIADYLNSKAVFGFDNVASMKTSTNLIDGSYAKTLGYYTKNDKGGSLYKIRTITNSDVIDEKSIIALSDENLIAELIVNNEINTRQFGIKKDDTNDISADLQALITFAKNNNLKVIANNDDVFILDDKVIIDNVNIDFNNATINPDNQLYILFDVGNNTHVSNLIVRYEESIQSGLGYVYNLIGDNIEIDNCDLQAFCGVYSNTSNTNIKIHDNILNNIRNNILMQNGTFKNIDIYNNVQNIPQTQSTPNASNNCILVFSGIKYPFDTSTLLTKTDLEDSRGNNINVYNNKFKQINLRSIYLANFDNANIYSNYTDNPYGDKTGHTLVGYSDDVYVLDLCINSSIHHNVVTNSGENGIDILSCKNTTCSHNILNGINADGINIDVSDAYSNGVIQSDIDINFIKCENIVVSENEIETDNVCVSLLYGINTTIINNIFRSTPAGDSGSTQVSVLLSTETGSRFFSEVGHWGTLIIKDNQFLGKMHIANQRAGMWTNDNSKIYLSEENGYKFTINVDNTDYADGKTYTFAHDEKFDNCKVYVIDPSNVNRKYELPLTNNGTKGIVNYSNGRYAFSITTKQVFTNLPQTAQTATYYNLSVGTLEVHLW